MGDNPPTECLAPSKVAITAWLWISALWAMVWVGKIGVWRPRFKGCSRASSNQPALNKLHISPGSYFPHLWTKHINLKTETMPVKWKPLRVNNPCCSCNHCILQLTLHRCEIWWGEELRLARGTWLIGGRRELATKTWLVLLLSIPTRAVLNVGGWGWEIESEWEKSEKRRDLILHITVLLIQTSQIISSRVCICGYIFHWLR